MTESVGQECHFYKAVAEDEYTTAVLQVPSEKQTTLTIDQLETYIHVQLNDRFNIHHSELIDDRDIRAMKRYQIVHPQTKSGYSYGQKKRQRVMDITFGGDGTETLPFLFRVELLNYKFFKVFLEDHHDTPVVGIEERLFAAATYRGFRIHLMQQLPDTLSLAMTQYIFRLANGLGVSETAEKNTYAMPGIAAGGGTGTMINPFEVCMIRFHYYKFEFPYNDNIGSSVALFPWQTETITVGNFWQVIQQRLNEDQPFHRQSVTKHNFGFVNANTAWCASHC